MLIRNGLLLGARTNQISFKMLLIYDKIQQAFILNSLLLFLIFLLKTFIPLLKKLDLYRYGTPSKQITYTVKKGDTLWDISKKYLGDGSKYKEIKLLNGLSSDTIYPDQKLKINL